jgi:hypothetical protein
MGYHRRGKFGDIVYCSSWGRRHSTFFNAVARDHKSLQEHRELLSKLIYAKESLNFKEIDFTIKICKQKINCLVRQLYGRDAQEQDFKLPTTTPAKKMRAWTV